MRPIAFDDVLDLVAYEKARDRFLEEIIAHKGARRVSLGDRLTFIFENRMTVLFQIQEMIRTERIVDDDAIQEEIDVYNELIPGDDELSATLMVEIPEAEQIRTELDQLVGIDEYVALQIGDERLAATFDPKQFEEDRISAVQYVRFPLGSELAARFRDPVTPLALTVTHPNYEASTPLSGDVRDSLVRDLEAE